MRRDRSSFLLLPLGRFSGHRLLAATPAVERASQGHGAEDANAGWLRGGGGRELGQHANVIARSACREIHRQRIAADRRKVAWLESTLAGVKVVHSRVGQEVAGR